LGSAATFRSGIRAVCQGPRRTNRLTGEGVQSHRDAEEQKKPDGQKDDGPQSARDGGEGAHHHVDDADAADEDDDQETGRQEDGDVHDAVG
jgi:hypothetical protein